MARRDETTLLQSVREQLNNCAGWEGDRIAADRKEAWRYYHQRKRGDELAGRSTVVAGDVSAMVEAVLAQMDDAFSSDALVDFQAMSAQDTDQAQLESDCVADAISRSNGIYEILSAIKSALLLRNGVVKIFVEKKRDKQTREFTNVEPEALGQLLAPQPKIESRVVEYDPDAKTLEMEITRIAMRLRACAVPLANFFYPTDLDTMNLQNAGFCAERHVDTRAVLIDEHQFPASKVNKLRAFTVETKTDLLAQMPGQIGQMNLAGIDKSQDLIEWFECYADTEDGRMQICVSLQDSVLLYKGSVSLTPYAAGCVFINPNRFTGISLYDKVKQIQDINTGLDRALLDNANTVNKNRVAAFDGIVNMDDLTDGRPNGTIRVRQGVGIADVRSAVSAFTVPDISQGLLMNIEHQKQTRAEMGGAALTLATGEMQLSDRAGSQGIDRAYSVMEQLSSHMTKVIAKTLIRSVYLLAHETMRQNFDYPVSVKQGGRWASTVPSQWPMRDNVFIKVGMSPGERQRRVNMLAQMMQNQIALASNGMDEVLVNLDGFYSTIVDWARAGDVANPERYLVDPQSDESKKAREQKQARQAADSDMQKQLLKQALSLEQIRSAIEKYKTDVETQFKYYNANLNAEIEEAKLVGQAAIDMIKAKEQPQPIGGKPSNGKPATATKPAAQT